MKKLTAWGKYFFAALLPVAILMFLPLRPIIISSFGESVVLEASAVDPTDLLRGDYVSLSFKICMLTSDMFGEKVNDVIRGSEWYVSLSPDESGVWKASGATVSVPSGVYITGTVKKISSSAATMDYGNALSRVYVKERTGIELDNVESLLVDVSLLHGSAVIRSVQTTTNKKILP